ncbi:hypothetical protein IMG5_000110 [Ichthyophthirius multifiliis]|uniref:Uncharacterized protein n=1 Tax=Ichthyophthirius multifiliis TaxID=5932 RepID=G0QIN9_ICHMU|nr:hypothetical protein IMG5_000110 [Ichthyophthirius multifiliis]EGR34914.1 hypothetical protein IMG5_000110 [Ichthyophthirius multifiliis]|eukprot:XP_004040218.1 hypothetical protein IMG5_000110 [Ichthyophthirius multifiliis]
MNLQDLKLTQINKYSTFFLNLNQEFSLVFDASILNEQKLNKKNTENISLYIEMSLEEISQKTQKQPKTRSEKPIGQALKTSLKSIQNTQICLQLDTQTSIQIKINIKDSNTCFHRNFLGFACLKILETRTFQAENIISSIKISLNSMENSMQKQIWNLKPFKTFLQENNCIQTWDFQHNLIYEKNLQKTKENTDIQLNFLTKINFELDKVEKINEEKMEEDFQILLENYSFLDKYEDILYQNNGFIHSNLQNHIFFETYGPFDYFSVQFLDKNNHVLALYEEDFFQIPQKQLNLAFICQDKDNIVQNKYLQVNQEELLDDQEQQNIIGSFKFQVQFESFNQYLMPEEKERQWVDKLVDYKKDDDNLMYFLKENISNYVKNQQKIQPLVISLVDIWNIQDLVQQISKNDKKCEFFIKIKIGNICEKIKFSQKIKKSEEIEEIDDILLELEKKGSFLKKIEDKLKIYTMLDQKSQKVSEITTDTDLCQKMVFQIKSFLEFIQIEVLIENEIIGGFCRQIQECFFYDKEGFLYFLVSFFNNSGGQNLNFTGFFLKFQYSFLSFEQENSYNQSLFQPGIYIPKQMLFQDKQLVKKMQNFIYKMTIQEVESKKSCEEVFSFNNFFQKINMKFFQELSFLRNNQKKDIMFLVQIKKIYSENNQNNEENIEENEEKKYAFKNNFIQMEISLLKIFSIQKQVQKHRIQPIILFRFFLVFSKIKNYLKILNFQFFSKSIYTLIPLQNNRFKKQKFLYRNNSKKKSFLMKFQIKIAQLKLI